MGTTLSYASGTSNAYVPSHIVASKKQWLLEILEDHRGQWITNRQLAEWADQAGLKMNQVTARISDLRDDLYPDGFGIFSEADDADRGLWRYKLDVVTPDYSREYEGRRPVGAMTLTANDLVELMVLLDGDSQDIELVRGLSFSEQKEIGEQIIERVRKNEPLNDAAFETFVKHLL